MDRPSSHPAVLIPVRGFATGKSRLAGALDDAARARLIRSMADAAMAAAAAFDVHVVTADPEVAVWARAHGARVAPDAGRGLNPVLEEARSVTSASGADPVLVLFADLPEVTTDDVDAMLDGRAQGVAIAPDEAGTGTNALCVSRLSSLRFCFGPGSFAAHLAQAPDAWVVRRPGLARDLDEPSSLSLPTSEGG